MSDNKFDRSHGSLFDRGRADSYYRRGTRPHYWPEGTGRGEEIVVTDEESIAEYMAGYNESEAKFDFKDWG